MYLSVEFKGEGGGGSVSRTSSVVDSLSELLVTTSSANMVNLATGKAG